MPTESQHHSHGAAPFPWPQLTVLIVGFLYVLFGLVGFWVSGFGAADPVQGPHYLLGIEVSTLRNLVHLAVGLVGAACATRMPAARGYGWLLLVVGVVEAVFGVVALVSPGIDPLGMNLPALVVALVTAVLGLVIALGRAHSEVPYDRLQAGAERAGRRAMRLDEE